jgi:hypothetical protein
LQRDQTPTQESSAENRYSYRPLEAADDQVRRIGPNLQPGQIEAFEAVSDATARETILKVIGKEIDSDRKLRTNIAYTIFIILFLELVAGNFGLFKLGFGEKPINDPSVAKVFFTGLFTQVVAITLIVVKYLFPSTKVDPISRMNELMKKHTQNPPQQ